MLLSYFLNRLLSLQLVFLFLFRSSLPEDALLCLLIFLPTHSSVSSKPFDPFPSVLQHCFFHSLHLFASFPACIRLVVISFHFFLTLLAIHCPVQLFPNFSLLFAPFLNLFHASPTLFKILQLYSITSSFSASLLFSPILFVLASSFTFFPALPSIDRKIFSRRFFTMLYFFHLWPLIFWGFPTVCPFFSCVTVSPFSTPFSYPSLNNFICFRSFPFPPSPIF